MDIIDCHVHIGKNKHINASVKDLLKSMDEAGIDKALVYAAPIADMDNETLIKAISKHRNRLYPVLAHSPHLGTLDILSIAEHEGAVGIKFYTGYEHFYPEDIQSVIDSIGQLNIPLIFHMGDTLRTVKSARLKYAKPLLIDDIASDFEELTFVIAHMGYPWHKDTAAVCYKNDNVYADISGFVYGEFTGKDAHNFDQVIAEFTSFTGSHDKLLFGTDFPISDQTSDRKSVV
jgi:predicted TIM-barrel fold metal-dependent hydrolase